MRGASRTTAAWIWTGSWVAASILVCVLAIAAFLAEGTVDRHSIYNSVQIASPHESLETVSQSCRPVDRGIWTCDIAVDPTDPAVTTTYRVSTSGSDWIAQRVGPSRGEYPMPRSISGYVSRSESGEWVSLRWLLISLCVWLVLVLGPVVFFFTRPLRRAPPPSRAGLGPTPEKPTSIP